MLRIIISLLVLSTLAGVYYFFARGNFDAVIQDQVYRSAQLGAPELQRIIKQHGIRSIVNLRGAHPREPWYRQQRAVALQLGVAHHDLRFSAAGLPPITEVLRLKRVLQNTERPLLIHCQHGADRTGMASALTLLLDSDQSIDQVQKQLSARYFIFSGHSTGRLLLDEYVQWLATNNARHNSTLFAHWLETDYVDGNGNMRFYIDQINGVIWQAGTQYEDDYEYVIDRHIDPSLMISGWAIDIHNRRLVKSLDIYLEGRHLGNTKYGFAYTGVASYFGDERYMDSGWMLSKPVLDWKPGCYDLTIEIVRLDSTAWHSAPQARVCLR
ncbi:MAG: tyrosine-protein phosphatase [Gammaproteobacteria bacterium]